MAERKGSLWCVEGRGFHSSEVCSLVCETWVSSLLELDEGKMSWLCVDCIVAVAFTVYSQVARRFDRAVDPWMANLFNHSSSAHNPPTQTRSTMVFVGSYLCPILAKISRVHSSGGTGCGSDLVRP